MSVLLFDYGDPSQIKGWRGRPRSYDYSRFLTHFSEESLLSLCNELRRIHINEITNLKTFKDNYLTPSYDFLDSFISWMGPVSRFCQNHWFDFSDFHEELINRSSDADKTKTKKLRFLQSFSALICRIGWIQECPIVRTITESRKTKEFGSASDYKKPKEKIDRYQQLYAFRLEGHSRPYDFSRYTELGEAFLSTMLVCFKSYVAPGTGRAYYKALNSFLNYLLGQKHHGGSDTFFRELREDFRAIQGAVWEVLVYEWRDALILDATAGNRSLLGPHNSCSHLGRFWKVMADDGVVQSVLIAGIKNARKRSSANQRRKSLVELSESQTNQISEAANNIIEKLSEYLTPEEREESKRFIASFVLGIDESTSSTLDVNQLMAMMFEINESRLCAIKDIAKEEFDHWYKHWEIGQKAIEEAKKRFRPGELGALLDSKNIMQTQKNRNAHKYLRSGTDFQRLGNFLLYIIENYEGRVIGRGGRVHHIIQGFARSDIVSPRSGGLKDAIQAFLAPHRYSSVALWTLLLVETGANCEVAREAPDDIIRSTNDPNEALLMLGEKSRAGGKIIADVVDKNSYLIEAITRFQEMNSVPWLLSYPRVEEAKNRLFRHYGIKKREIVSLTEFNARNWFKTIINQSHILQNLAVLPSHIRSSVLMNWQHKNENDLLLAQVLADHSSSAQTDVYTGRAPIRIAYNLKIQEFQSRYQAVIIATIDGAPQKLGISAEEHKRILSEAFRTGLGVACLDPYAGVQPGVEPGAACARFENCHDCKMSWVVATENNIIDLILFNEHLKKSELEVSAKSPDRWERFWLPWLVFTEIAINKLKSGESARAYISAQPRLEERRKDYQPIPLL